MINILSAILFSLSANIDNIALGIAYGVKKIHISFHKNFLIALFTSIITIISMQLGNFILNFLSESFANIIGSIALICIGTFGILKWLYYKLFKKLNDNDENIHFKKLELKELIIIVFTLSWNNIAARFCCKCRWY